MRAACRSVLSRMISAARGLDIGPHITTFGSTVIVLSVAELVGIDGRARDQRCTVPAPIMFNAKVSHRSATCSGVARPVPPYQ